MIDVEEIKLPAMNAIAGIHISASEKMRNTPEYMRLWARWDKILKTIDLQVFFL